jgi:hypothetical protein
MWPGGCLDHQKLLCHEKPVLQRIKRFVLMARAAVQVRLKSCKLLQCHNSAVVMALQAA